MKRKLLCFTILALVFTVHEVSWPRPGFAAFPSATGLGMKIPPSRVGGHSIPAAANPAFDPFDNEIKAYPEMSDPYEGFNRAIYKFNHYLSKYVLDPVTKVYSALMPEAVRECVANVFSNLGEPARAVASLAVGDGRKSATALARLLINTTAGIGGMFDVARRFGLNPVIQDVDLALGKAGIPAGPYLVLPILGPSTARHAVGRAADLLLNPAIYFLSVSTIAEARAGDKINEYSFYMDELKQFERYSLDPYTGIQGFYYERRMNIERGAGHPAPTLKAQRNADERG